MFTHRDIGETGQPRITQPVTVKRSTLVDYMNWVRAERNKSYEEVVVDMLHSPIVASEGYPGTNGGVDFCWVRVF
jgi:hypothetical protein